MKSARRYGGHSGQVADPADALHLHRGKAVAAGDGDAELAVAVASPRPHGAIALHGQRMEFACRDRHRIREPGHLRGHASVAVRGVTELTVEIESPAPYRGV